MTRRVVLGIDTAAGAAVGLAVDGVPVARASVEDSRLHAESLAPLIASVLSKAGLTWPDVTEIAVGMGPGPFTGLRVGIACAHTLGFALNVPVRHACSLDVLALAHEPDGEGFTAVLDARRHEVYWARYDAAGKRAEGPAIAPAGAAPAAGPARSDDPAASPDSPARAWPPFTPVDAGLLAARIDELPEAGPEPLYLRRPDAAVSHSAKSVLTERSPR